MNIGLTQPLGHGRRLDIQSLEAPDGKTLVIFGPNGAGKTTLLRRLAGTLPGGPALDAAYLPQRVVSLRGSTRRNLEMGLNAVGRQRATVLASELGISESLETRARMLSGGERQRMALARTLAAEADVVLLDEPLAQLDLSDRSAVAASVARALEGRTAIITTHDRQTAAALGDRLAVLVDGTVRQVGDPSEVFTLPDSETVADALGIANVLAGRVKDADGGLVGLTVGPLVVWGVGGIEPVGRAIFGAEAVTIYAGDRPESGSARNSWPGTVAAIREIGGLVEVLVECGPQIAALVTPGAMVGLGIKVGDLVTVAVKATAVRVL